MEFTQEELELITDALLYASHNNYPNAGHNLKDEPQFQLIKEAKIKMYELFHTIRATNREGNK